MASLTKSLSGVQPYLETVPGWLEIGINEGNTLAWNVMDFWSLVQEAMEAVDEDPEEWESFPLEWQSFSPD